MALKACVEEGVISSLDVDLLFCFGAVSVYPRSTTGEALQAFYLNGSAYQVPTFRGRVRVAFVNKVPSGAYRAVGQPIASADFEQSLDDAAAAIGMDLVAIRRLNHLPPTSDEGTMQLTPGGIPLRPLSWQPFTPTHVLDVLHHPEAKMEQVAMRRFEESYAPPAGPIPRTAADWRRSPGRAVRIVASTIVPVARPFGLGRRQNAPGVDITAKRIYFE